MWKILIHVKNMIHDTHIWHADIAELTLMKILQ